MYKRRGTVDRQMNRMKLSLHEQLSLPTAGFFIHNECIMKRHVHLCLDCFSDCFSVESDFTWHVLYISDMICSHAKEASEDY